MGTGAVSMSLNERVQKGVLVGPPFTQGPKGSRGSSGSRGLKTSERGRNTETEEEKQRWAEMGRMAGRQTAEEFFFFKKREKKAQDLEEAVILRSPTCQVQAANEEAEGSRAYGGLEVSEKSAVCLPQEKTLNKSVLCP